jgi:hypothetical protein
MRDYYYKDAVRLDWGFGNPNITGSLIVLLMLALWMFAYLPRGWGKAGFWLALLANAILGAFTIQTFSRGAMLSWLVGAAILVWYAPRPWKPGRWIPISLVAIALLGYGIATGFADRALNGMSGEDRSVTNRWLIYKVIPRMMWDAPEGWGYERAAEAFRQWYQPIGKGEIYGRLVNSHATWLVEWPWHLRLAYLAGWAAIVTLCLPHRAARGRNLFAIATGIWISFFVGSIFTTIAHRWQLWIVPICILLIVLGLRVKVRSWPPLRAWGRAVIGLTITLGLLLLAALFTPSDISLRDGIVRVSATAAKEHWLLLGIDESVLGRFYGHQIRRQHGLRQAAISVRWQQGARLPNGLPMLVCPGKVAAMLDESAKGSVVSALQVVFVNPDPPSVVLAEILSQRPLSRCLIGGFSGGQSRIVWEALADRLPELHLDTIEGAGRYLPTWIDQLSCRQADPRSD